jgi:uncharacterized membrane protein HdeD (DUF308 family)
MSAAERCWLRNIFGSRILIDNIGLERCQLRKHKGMRALQIGFEFEEVRKHRLWFRSFGILMIVIGLATAGSSITTNAILLGSLLVLAGLCQMVHSRARIRWSGLFLNLPSGILYFTAGLLIICEPAIDTLTRARLLAVLLIVIGCLRLFVALSIPLAHHRWMMLDGLTAIISGFSIWDSWPISGLWYSSLLMGLNMMSEGHMEIRLSSRDY